MLVNELMFWLTGVGMGALFTHMFLCVRSPAPKSSPVPPPAVSSWSLSFQDLRRANHNRQPYWSHKCEDWTPAHWLQAMVGELGEYANIRKKLDRGDTIDALAGSSGETFVSQIADELADTQIYLDMLAYSNGIDLEKAVRSKFNRTSDEIRCPIKL